MALTEPAPDGAAPAAAAAAVPISAALPDGLRLRAEPLRASPRATAAKPPPPAPSDYDDASSASLSRMGAHCSAIDRFGRLSAILANERTLLAWTRTGLAAGRTAFAFLGLTVAAQAAGGWSTVLTLSTMVMASLWLLLLGIGMQRFIRVKTALELCPEKIALHFDRVSIRPLFAVLLAVCVANCCGWYSQQWVKGHQWVKG